jgi:hypothetical protein
MQIAEFTFALFPNMLGQSCRGIYNMYFGE